MDNYFGKYFSLNEVIISKFLGNITIVKIEENCITIETKGNNKIEMAYSLFGSVVFIDETHLNIEYTSHIDYFNRYEIENKIDIKTPTDKVDQLNADLIKNSVINNVNKSKSANIKKIKIQLIDMLKTKYGFDGLYHYTDFHNFIKVMEIKKLLSRSKATEIGFVDAANTSIIKHTSDFVKRQVRFYYKEKTPTFFDNEGIKLDNGHPHMPLPVILLFDENLILNENVTFTNGCAGSNISELTSDPKEALNYDWMTIFKRGPIDYYEDKRKIVNRRNSELLISDEVDLIQLKKIIFRSKADLNNAISILGNNLKFTLDFNEEKFNYNNNFLKEYDIGYQNDKVYMALNYYRNPSKYDHKLLINYKDGYIDKLDKDKINELVGNTKKINKYITFDYYMLYKPIRNSGIRKIEYFMNDHLSAIWKG